MYNSCVMLKRVQVLLENKQYDALKAQAKRRRTSLSEILRSMVHDVLKKADWKAERAGLAGFISDPGFSGKDHDKVLYGSDGVRGPVGKKSVRPACAGRGVRR